MTTFNISAIRATHNDVDQRLHNLSQHDGGLAHQHRRVLLDVILAERKDAGVEPLQALIQELKGKLRQTEEQVAGAREAAAAAAKDAAELRAELGAARRTIGNLKADIAKLDAGAGQALQHAALPGAEQKTEVPAPGKPFPARRVPADLLPGIADGDDFADPVTAPLLRPPAPRQ